MLILILLLLDFCMICSTQSLFYKETKEFLLYEYTSLDRVNCMMELIRLDDMIDKVYFGFVSEKEEIQSSNEAYLMEIEHRCNPSLINTPFGIAIIVSTTALTLGLISYCVRTHCRK